MCCSRLQASEFYQSESENKTLRLVLLHCNLKMKYSVVSVNEHSIKIHVVLNGSSVGINTRCIKFCIEISNAWKNVSRSFEEQQVFFF